MKIDYNYPTYEKVLMDNIQDFQLIEPKFIPISDDEPVYILTKGQVWSPTLKTATDIKINKAVKVLAKKSEYVIFSEKRIIGTDEHVLTEFDFQPREETYIWLVVDRLAKKLCWFKEYGTTSSIHDFITSFMVVNVDSISNDKGVTEMGKQIYRELFEEILNISFWNAESFDILLELNTADWCSPFYAYNIRKLFGEGI